jgi:hypothetical protein
MKNEEEEEEEEERRRRKKRGFFCFFVLLLAVPWCRASFFLLLGDHDATNFHSKVFGPMRFTLDVRTCH